MSYKIDRQCNLKEIEIEVIACYSSVADRKSMTSSRVGTNRDAAKYILPFDSKIECLCNRSIYSDDDLRPIWYVPTSQQQFMRKWTRISHAK